MTCNELKSIPLINILQYLQIPCSKMTEKEAWFKNPFNGGNERTASTKVDLQRNIWYSHSEGIGGNNIDFLMRYLGASFLVEVLAWADERKNILSFHQQKLIENSNTQQIGEPNYAILSVKPLTNKNLLDYIASRKIDLDIGKKYCREIYYRMANGKTYFAISFVNDSGGYELRSSYDKRTLLGKDITTIDNKKKDALLFEGFMDWLSFLTIRKNSDIPYLDVDYCILNSTANLEKAYPFLETHRRLFSYLDNDISGIKAYQALTQKFSERIEVINGMEKLTHSESKIKDVNDYLLSISKKDEIRNDPGTNSYRMSR